MYFQPSDSGAMAATISDATPFAVGALSEEMKKQMGVQLATLIPMCYFDGKPCDVDE